MNTKKPHISKAACLAALLALAPATGLLGQGSEPKPRTDLRMQAGDDSTVTIDGRQVNLLRMRGTEVLGTDGDSIGRVTDVVFNRDTGEAAYLIASADQWFGNKAAVIPVRAIDFKRSPRVSDLPNLEARAWWNGRQLKVNMDEGAFDDFATFQDDADINLYLSRNAGDLAMQFGLDAADLVDPNAEYARVFTPDFDQDDFDQGGFAAADSGQSLQEAPSLLGSDVAAAGRGRSQQRVDAESEEDDIPVYARDREGLAEGGGGEFRRTLPGDGERGAGYIAPPDADEPLADRVGRVKTPNLTRSASDSEIDWKDRYVEVDGESIAALQVRGTQVINQRSAPLGVVDDIVVNESSGKAEYLVVETDAWFDDRKVLMPIEGIDFKSMSVFEPGKIGESAENQIKLEMTEQRFNRLADFGAQTDVTSYLRERGAELAQTFGASQKADSKAKYTLVFGDA